MRADVAAVAARQEPWVSRLFVSVLVVGSLLGGLVAAAVVLNAGSPLLLAVPLFVLPVVLWKRPELGPLVLVLAAATIEQFPYTVGPRNGAATDRIPFFHGLDATTHVTPADLLLLLLLVVWIVKRGSSATSPWPNTTLSRLIAAFLGTVAVGLLVGLAHHGTLRVALMEIRPFAYLAAAYVVAVSLIRTRRAMNAVFWMVVLGSGFKAVQGLVIFVQVRHVQPRPDAVLGHEEAFFFGLFVLLILALWLYEIDGPLRTTGTLLLPIVLAADLVNSRRTGFLILAVGVVALSVIGFVTLPHRRRFLRRFGVCALIGAAVYLPAYWNHTGGFAQPARAIRSLVSPNARDQSSDLYRVQENANLKLNIRQAGVLGKGFGVPINYQLPIADIRSIDPLITYIPHNGVLYVVLRLGILGTIAFWSLLGAAITGGCLLARSRNRELAAFGAVFVCALLAYAIQGYNDQGFFFYRIAIVMGLLLGLYESARRWNAEEAEPS